MTKNGRCADIDGVAFTEVGFRLFARLVDSSRITVRISPTISRRSAVSDQL
ncbi:hypothetical protein ACVXG8_12220 [Escherichia coli]